MMKSMTAYACVEHTDQQLTVTAEIRSYNSRFLDLVLRLPSGFGAQEETIKRLIGSYLERGRIEVRIQVRNASEDALRFELDVPRAKAYWEAIKSLKEMFGLSDNPDLDHLLAIPGLVTQTENETTVEAYWPVLETCLRQGLQNLDAMRVQEGSYLRRDFDQRLQYIEDALVEIHRGAEGLPSQYREKLLLRLENLTAGTVELDQVRLAQEVALMADRTDISEEIVRARSHIEQFKNLMNADEPVGRKLNFLLQEFNREFNTMGAKVGQAEIAHVIVDVKAEIEKLREQVQNIE